MILHSMPIPVRDHHQTHRSHIEPIGGLGLALLVDGGQRWPEGEQREREKSLRERKGRGRNLKERETWESQEQVREKRNKRLVMNFSGKIDYLEQSTNGTWSLSAADPLVMNFVLCFGLCQLRIRVTIVMLTIFVENLVAVI